MVFFWLVERVFAVVPGWLFAEEWFECEWLCGGEEEEGQGGKSGFVYASQVTQAGSRGDDMCRHRSQKARGCYHMEVADV